LRQGTEKSEKSYQIEQPFFIQFALSILIICSILAGFVLSDLFNPNNDFFNFTNFSRLNKRLSMDKYPVNSLFFENEFLP
jgi:hypothetical protein